MNLSALFLYFEFCVSCVGWWFCSKDELVHNLIFKNGKDFFWSVLWTFICDHTFQLLWLLNSYSAFYSLFEMENLSYAIQVRLNVEWIFDICEIHMATPRKMLCITKKIYRINLLCFRFFLCEIFHSIYVLYVCKKDYRATNSRLLLRLYIIFYVLYDSFRFCRLLFYHHLKIFFVLFS